MTFILIITLAGAPLFPDANNVPFDTARDCSETATIVVGIHPGPIEAACYESEDGRKLGKQISVASRT